MRVLLLNQTYHPDVVATAQHAHDLGIHLAQHGIEVHAIASRSLYGQRGATLPRCEEVDGVTVHRVGRSLFGKAGIAARILDFVLFYLAATTRALTMPRPDVVVCFTTPPFIALSGWLLRRIRGASFVYWVMDLYPDLPVACGVMRPRSLFTRFFESVNRFCLRRADRVVVLGRCMERRVQAKGVDPARIELIHVWADPDEIVPVAPEDNELRHEWGLDDRFVVMYSGNFGLGHDVRTMCDAAARLTGDPSIRFLFVGGGKRLPEVERLVAAGGLPNVMIAPYQPRARLGITLGCGDVHLISLREGVEGIMVPSKLYGIMAAARPAIFIGHPDSELARVIEEESCGLHVREGDADGLVAAIRSLATDPQRVQAMGARARAAIAGRYARGRSCEAWRLMLEGLRTPGTTPVAATPSEPGSERTC